MVKASVITTLKNRKQNGFTIVELLIVIVVIGILAAITTVAFNGVQQRARESSATSAASQAKKKLTLYHVDNGSYPLTGNLAAAGVTSGSDSTFQYTSDGSTYCLTATSVSASFMVRESTVPMNGICSGHNSSGSVTMITNLVRDPSATTLTNFGIAGSASGAVSIITDGTAYSGNTYARRTSTSTNNAGIGYGTTIANRVSVSAETNYTFSVYARSSNPFDATARIGWYDASGAQIGATPIGETVKLDTGWKRMLVSAPSPSGAVSARLFFASTYFTVPTNNAVDADGFMMTEGSSIYPYADGGSSGWSWSGSANASSSSGPAL